MQLLDWEVAEYEEVIFYFEWLFTVGKFLHQWDQYKVIVDAGQI